MFKIRHADVAQQWTKIKFLKSNKYLKSNHSFNIKYTVDSGVASPTI